MRNNWKRTEQVVDKADPTAVVFWQKEDLSISEFQGIYTTRREGIQADRLSTIAELGEELHKALEHGWHLEQEANEERRAEADSKCPYRV
jgi:hypothetical protein